MTQKHRYIPGLDGLRAFAVLSVMAYHFGFSWARGGFLGVDIFFVLSGYLITSIALPTKGNQIDLNLREFWVKRIRRLFPAAFVMIITTFVWVMLFHRDLLNTVRGDTISSIFYASNWWFIFHKLSYFDSFGSPSPLKNMWSLAIEEQFYILWPIGLLVGFYIVKKRSNFLIVLLGGILVSAVLMGVLYHPGEDPSRVYYGTDTRSFELLIGCFLAFVWPMKRLASNNLSIKLGNILNITSYITFCILILAVVFLDEFQSFLYRGGMVLICVITAILIACICHPASLLGRYLSYKPIRWIGSRSYGIYLWHYPVMVLSTPVYEIGNPVYWRVGLQLASICIIAELSYRFIEKPIRKNGLRAFIRQYFEISIGKWKRPFVGKIAAILPVLVLLVFTTGITGVVKSEQHKDVLASNPTEVKIDHEVQPSSNIDSVTNTSEQQEIENNSSNQENEEELVPKVEQNNETLRTDKNYTKILAIGDSVMLDIAESLHKKYPDMTVDGKVGRQVSQAVQLAQNYTNFNRPNYAVIIELGTNGYFTHSQLDALLQSFSKAHIYLVNTRVPRPWEGKVNRALEAKAIENDHITLINWHSKAINHPEYFTSDGVHLVPKGIEALTTLIDQAINSN